MYMKQKRDCQISPIRAYLDSLWIERLPCGFAAGHNFPLVIRNHPSGVRSWLCGKWLTLPFFRPHTNKIRSQMRRIIKYAVCDQQHFLDVRSELCRRLSLFALCKYIISQWRLSVKICQCTPFLNVLLILLFRHS